MQTAMQTAMSEAQQRLRAPRKRKPRAETQPRKPRRASRKRSEPNVTGPSIPSNIPTAATSPQTGNIPANKSYTAMGKDIGQQIANIRDSADGTMRKLLLAVALEILADSVKQDAFLEGYGEALAEKFLDSTVRVMKSQAKKIFQAAAVASHTMTTGKAENGEPINETKSGVDWLTGFKGTFHQWCELSRNIVNGESSSTDRKPKKVSDSAEKKIKDLIAVAKPNQAHAIVDQAITKLPAVAMPELMGKATDILVSGDPEHWENRLLVAIEDMAIRIAEDSKNPNLKALAKAIAKTCDQAVTLLSKKEAEAIKNVEMPSGTLPTDNPA